jgi:hypothetical protein
LGHTSSTLFRVTPLGAETFARDVKCELMLEAVAFLQGGGARAQACFSKHRRYDLVRPDAARMIAAKRIPWDIGLALRACGLIETVPDDLPPHRSSDRHSERYRLTAKGLTLRQLQC